MQSARALLFALIGVMALGAAAQDAPPSPGITNAFGCQLKEGRNLDNVWSAMEALAAMEITWRGGPDPASSVFLWTPFRSASEFDFVWGYGNTDLKRMATGLEDYGAAPGAAAMEAQLDNLGACVSIVAESRDVRVAAIPGQADRVADAVVETYACAFLDGRGAADLDRVIAAWQTDVEKIASPGLKTYAAWLWTPMYGTRADTDVIWVGAYPTLDDWADGTSAYNASKEGQALEARFDTVLDCRANLWSGYWVIPPVTPAQ